MRCTTFSRRQAASKPLAVKQDPLSVRTCVTLKGNARAASLRKATALVASSSCPLLLGGLPGQLVRPAGVVLAVLYSALAPLADGLDAHAEALGQHAGGPSRAGNLLADGWGGAGLRMKRVHHVLLVR